MRTLLALVLFALGPLASAPAAAAQPLATPEILTLSIPIIVSGGTVEIEGRTFTGAQTPYLGFRLVNLDGGVYQTADVSGGVGAIIVCSVVECSGPTDEQGSGNWLFFDGIIVGGDVGGFVETPVGGVGGGVHASFSGVDSGVEDFTWIDYGVQGAYAAEIGPVAVMALGTYAWGYETESGGNSGRAVKLRAEVFLDREGIGLTGFVGLDRRTDSRGTDAEADDYRATYVMAGIGVGLF